MEFVDFLTRIKQELDFKNDKDVADFLGLEIKAFSARKKRNSVPQDKLRAAAQAHPEMEIDVEYILTGNRIKQKNLQKRNKIKLSQEEQELLTIYRQLEAGDRHALKRQAQMLLALAIEEKKSTTQNNQIPTTRKIA